MENNKVIGYLLIILLLVTYYTYFVPNYENNDSNNSNQSDKENINPDKEANNNDFNNNKNYLKKSEKQKDVVIENQDIIITFSNQGAYIKKVVLKNHYAFNKPLDLINEKSSIINYKLFKGDSTINFNELIFNYNINKNLDSTSINFYLDSNNGEEFNIKYNIPNSGYLISSKINLKSYDYENLSFYWSNKVIHQEKNYDYEKSVTTINYYDEDNNYDYLSASSTEIIEEDINANLKWISTKQPFFSSAIITNNIFNNTFLKSVYNEDTSFIKSTIIETKIPLINRSSSLSFYFGPNKYDILKNIANGFDKNVYLGWWGVNSFNKYIIIPIFNLLEQSISSYGLIIFIMVILIRIIITPFTYKSHISMAKMKIVSPEVNKIKEKYSGDMQKSQAEIMQLYQKTGVNPLGGCLPLLFQLPILISVFYFLPNAIELRQKSFLWAEDLSSYDSILNLPFSIPLYGDHVSFFTLLMTVSTILINSANSQMQTMEGPMKIMQYVLPVMFLFIFNNFSSGLTYYYFLSNVLSFGQVYLFRRLVNEDDIKKEIDYNRKQNLNVKKSSFRIRLEEAMKANQEAQKNRKKNNT